MIFVPYTVVPSGYNTNCMFVSDSSTAKSYFPKSDDNYSPPIKPNNNTNNANNYNYSYNYSNKSAKPSK